MWAKWTHKPSLLPLLLPPISSAGGNGRLHRLLLPTITHAGGSRQPHRSSLTAICSAAMASISSRVAVIGSGISGSMCASILAAKGVSVTVFESGRGAGGRMAQRREVSDDGKELCFDHGAPYFTITDAEAMNIVKSWEARGLIAEWNEEFDVFDVSLSRFEKLEKNGTIKKYVGFPGMNSICKALCQEPGVEARFGVTVGNMEWVADKTMWKLTSLNGQCLGNFDGIVASDKNVFSQKFTGLTGRPPPLDVKMLQKMPSDLQHVSFRSRFILMLAFSEPLQSIPVKGFLFKNSDVLSSAFCDSSKPGRSRASSHECWVLHSSAEYAAGVIARTGLQKLSGSALAEIAEELFKEFQSLGLCIHRPFFMKAHRWGSALPIECIAGENKCLWDCSKRLAICGDFCAGDNVEGALLSGVRAASMFLGYSSSY